MFRFSLALALALQFGLTTNVSAISEIELGCKATFQAALAPCTPIALSDPIAISGSTSRNPPDANNAFVEAVAYARPGHVGVQTIARADTVYDFVGKSITVEANARAVSNDLLDIRSYLPRGTEREIVLSSHVDFGMRAVAHATTLYEYTSSYGMSLNWDAWLTSISAKGVVLDQAHFFGEIVESKSSTSFADGGFVRQGDMRGTDRLTVDAGGRVNLKMQLRTTTIGSGADFGDQNDHAHIDFVTSALNSFHLFLDVPTQDLQLVSASGHDYASPVPEASTWLLFIAGLLGMPAWRQRLVPVAS